MADTSENLIVVNFSVVLEVREASGDNSCCDLCFYDNNKGLECPQACSSLSSDEYYSVKEVRNGISV